MIAIDNFEHIGIAYGCAVAERAASVVRLAIGQWLGPAARIHLAEGGIFYGTIPADHPDCGSLQPTTGGSGAEDDQIRLLASLPFIILTGRDYGLCLALSVNRVADFAASSALRRAGETEPRKPFFGQAAGRGKAWIARYRADMAAATEVLAAVGKAGAAPVIMVDRQSTGSPVRAPFGGAMTTLPPTGLAMPPLGGHVAHVWQPVRDGRGSNDVLFYEMCPQLIGADGRRRDLSEARPALERLGLAVALDRYLVEHALDLLEADPDLAVGVQVSAQSISASERWADVWQRLTGNRSVAGRLAISITETSTFPDFAGAIRCVARLQALGCAVGIDNFGLGYNVELFESGTALLDRAREGLAGCIVLDVRMPGVSGLEVQKRLAMLDIHTPVIVVSGFADIAMAVQAMKANAFEFLTKPFRDQDLFDAIGAAMEHDSSQAMQSRERRQATNLIRNLTAREHQVFVRLCNGQVGKQIAHDLGMSEATVKVHRRSILHKLDVKHLGELILTYAPIVGVFADETQ